MAEYIADKKPDQLSPLIIKKRLGYLVRYAKLGKPLTSTLAMTSIIREVDEYSVAISSRSVRFQNSPSRSSAMTTDKKTVPDLDKFSGKDEDYYSWRDSTVNKMGQSRLSSFLSDAAYVAKHNDLAVSVFYSMRAALQDGTAANLATALYDKKRYDPQLLWQEIENYYDTSVNRANVVLFEVKRLLNLRLDADTYPTQFISDFRACLLRLDKNQASLATDTDTLRALLLVAIQDDQFEPVRDSIVNDPTRDVDAILKELRDRDTSLQIKDSANSDMTSSRTIRRASHTQGNQKRPTTSGSTAWTIPRFLDSWKAAFGLKLFQLLLDWRSMAMYKKATQDALNSSFDTIVETVTGHSKNKRKSRRGGTDAASGSENATDGHDGAGAAQASGVNEDSEDRPRKRIRLRKGRCVVTERNA